MPVPTTTTNILQNMNMQTYTTHMKRIYAHIYLHQSIHALTHTIVRYKDKNYQV